MSRNRESDLQWGLVDLLIGAGYTDPVLTERWERYHTDPEFHAEIYRMASMATGLLDMLLTAQEGLSRRFRWGPKTGSEVTP